jgi:hypothetical protein
MPEQILFRIRECQHGQGKFLLHSRSKLLKLTFRSHVEFPHGRILFMWASSTCRRRLPADTS